MRQALFSKVGMVLVILLLTSACSNAHASSGVEIQLATQGDQLAFTRSNITVAAGEPVTIVFKNAAKSLQHNWVLVQGGDPVAKQISEAALTAGLEQGAMPTDPTNILAYTKLLQSGKTETLHFTAPTTAGAYTYLCTFPGHYLLGMKGTLNVKP